VIFLTDMRTAIFLDTIELNQNLSRRFDVNLASTDETLWDGQEAATFTDIYSGVKKKVHPSSIPRFYI